MPTDVKTAADIKPGDLYEDSLKHPCLCVNKNGTEVSGISLVDGSYPRSDDINHSHLRKLTVEEAWLWRISGPRDIELSVQQRWWEKKPAYLINPAQYLENLYFFSLYQVEWSEKVIEHLGGPIRHEWHDIVSSIEDNGATGNAKISFKIFGSKTSGRVYVQAHKTTRDWLFADLSVHVDDGEVITIIKNDREVT